jgi:hypothetical protein
MGRVVNTTIHAVIAIALTIIALKMPWQQATANQPMAVNVVGIDTPVMEALGRCMPFMAKNSYNKC